MADFGEARVEWLRSLGLPGSCPGHDTSARVFRALDPVAFAEAFAMWTQGLGGRLGREVVALDGKAARRAVEAGQNPRHLVSAWATESGSVLGHLQVSEKSNEITAVPALLRHLELAGCIVTADALHCQKSIAREIIEADADHVLALKGNQGTAHGEIRSFLDDAILRKARGLATHSTVEKGHGRIETRTCWQSEDIAWFADRAGWTGLRSVGVVESTREISDTVSTGRRYHLTSLPSDAVLFAKAVRSHRATREPMPLGPRRRLPRGPVPSPLRPRHRQPRPPPPPRPRPPQKRDLHRPRHPQKTTPRSHQPRSPRTNIGILMRRPCPALEKGCD